MGRSPRVRASKAIRRPFVGWSEAHRQLLVQPTSWQVGDGHGLRVVPGGEVAPCRAKERLCHGGTRHGTRNTSPIAVTHRRVVATLAHWEQCMEHSPLGSSDRSWSLEAPEKETCSGRAGEDDDTPGEGTRVLSRGGGRHAVRRVSRDQTTAARCGQRSTSGPCSSGEPLQGCIASFDSAPPRAG